MPMKQSVIRAGSAQSFAAALRTLRTAHHPPLSQRMLADALGVSRGAYARYENGTRLPSAWFAAKIAAYYGVSTDELII